MIWQTGQGATVLPVDKKVEERLVFAQISRRFDLQLAGALEKQLKRSCPALVFLSGFFLADLARSVNNFS